MPNCVVSFRVILAVLVMHVAIMPAKAASVDEKIEALQRQIDELRAEVAAGRRQQPRVAQTTAEDVQSAPTAATHWPQPSFGGQYRINFYNADNGDNAVVSNTDAQRAARIRIRQNVDLIFAEQFKTHLQLELRHTTDNVTRTDSRRGGNSTDVSVRHAVMDYTFGNGANVQAGLVPLHDYYHDTQFSSDWDYNPLAAALVSPLGPGTVRVFAANLEEGAEEIESDDFVHYQADYTWPLGGDGAISFSGTVVNLQDDRAIGSGDSLHYNLGGGVRIPSGPGLTFSGSVFGSWTDRKLLGTRDDASGITALAELGGPVGPGEFGVLVSYASGDGDGTGYLAPMAFAQTYGYWGYTGILNVQGPTDTGFDFDAVNISNNGYGLTSVQAKYGFPVAPRLNGYLAAGWFGNTDATGRDGTLGYDLIGVANYRFTEEFALDLGMAYAHLYDSVSGYFQGVQHGGAGAPFNQRRGTERDKWSFFGRLQAEF
jgi:hypothetical protein